MYQEFVLGILSGTATSGLTSAQILTSDWPKNKIFIALDCSSSVIGLYLTGAEYYIKPGEVTN